MKQLIPVLLFLIPFSARSQCNAVQVNTIKLNPLGDCKYTISVTATLSNGNPSFEIFYTCDGEKEDLGCFKWNSPGKKTFTTDKFYCDCDENVYITIVVYSSSNCHGDRCIEVAETNLAITLTDFNAYQSDDQVCLTWRYYNDNLHNHIDERYYVEHSSDATNFEVLGVYQITDLRRIGDLSNICLYDRSLKQYYRLRVVDASGNTYFSAVKTITPKQNDLEYNTLTRELRIKGDIDDFTPRYLTVYSRDGREVYMRGITSNTMTLPELTHGIYFAVVTTPKGNLIKTIIL